MSKSGEGHDHDGDMHLAMSTPREGCDHDGYMHLAVSIVGEGCDHDDDMCLAALTGLADGCCVTPSVAVAPRRVGVLRDRGDNEERAASQQLL